MSANGVSDTGVVSEEKPIEFRNAFEPPFELSGFPWGKQNGKLRRLPATITGADLVKPEAADMHAWQTPGGEVRFCTSSPRVELRAELYMVNDKNHMARTGAAGFAFYTVDGKGQENFHGAAGLSADEAAKGNGFDGAGQFHHAVTIGEGGELCTVSIRLPLYSGVSKLEVGVEAGAQLLPPPPRRIKDPICFYGSSITQGTSASHPGSSYTALLCRALDAPQINLGFSGCARGEECMAEAIAGLKLAAFVLDYDHNAKTAEELQATHEKFFRIVRAARPELPIVIVSGPRDGRTEAARRRRDVVKQTFLNAVAAGDEKVWFVDGLHFYDQEGMPEIPRDFTTVDKTHPTDLGFYLMYRRILPELKKALGLG